MQSFTSMTRLRLTPSNAHSPLLGRGRQAAVHQRGVVLLAAISVLVLLAISSAAYLQLATLDRQIGETAEPDLTLVQAAMISRVELILLEDMEFDSESFHDDGKDWWDYPYTNREADRTVSDINGNALAAKGGKWDDAWLASTVMDFDLDRDGDGDSTNSDYGWRHLSNIEGLILRLPRKIEADKWEDDTAQGYTAITMPDEHVINFTSDDGDSALHTDTDVLYTTLMENDFITGDTVQVTPDDITKAEGKYGTDRSEWPEWWHHNHDRWGAQVQNGEYLDVYEPLGADADGDGVVDSFWTWAPLPSVGIYSYVSAYRIVDMSAMIPINSVTSGSGAANIFTRTTSQDRDTFRGYFPNHLDMMPLLSRAVDTNGSQFDGSDVENGMRRMMARMGYQDDNDDGIADAGVALNPESGLPTGGLVSEYLPNVNDDDTPNNDNGKFDRFPFKGGSASERWYDNTNGNDDIDNPADYFTNVIRSWASKSPYLSSDNTYELLYRYGLNRNHVQPQIEADLDLLVRIDSPTENSYTDVVGDPAGVDTRGHLIKWFIGEDSSATDGMEENSSVVDRDYYDLRKMLTGYSGGLKIKSPIVDTNGNVFPDVAFSFNPQNRAVYWNNSNPFFTHDGEANDDELLGFFEDWFGVIDNADTDGNKFGWWHNRLKTDRTNNSEDIHAGTISLNLASSIGDYMDRDSAMGEIEGNGGNYRHLGLERLPYLGEVYFQQAYKMLTTAGASAWIPKDENNHQRWVFELRNPFMQPITYADLNARRFTDTNDQYRFEIMVTRRVKDYDDNNRAQWVFTPDFDWVDINSNDKWDEVVIPPDGVAFFVYEKNPVDEDDYNATTPAPGTTLPNSGAALSDLTDSNDTDFSLQDKYGRTIQVHTLKLSANGVGDNSQETQGEGEYPVWRTDRNGKLFVSLYAPAEQDNENSWKRRRYDCLHHFSFKAHASYPVTAGTALADDFTQNLQISMARDCRGRRYLANPRNKHDGSWDSNVFVKQRLLPELEDGVDTNRYAGSFVSTQFCSVEMESTDRVSAAVERGADLIHQFGREAKAVKYVPAPGTPQYIRMADSTSWPDVDEWEKVFDALQLSSPGHPMLSETELMLIPPMHFIRDGRGDRIVTAEIFGNERDSNDDTNNGDDVQLDPRMYMWNLDYTAALLDFSGAYIGSKVTVAPPGGTLMDYLDVLGYANDGVNSDATDLVDDKPDMVVPYRININTAPLHVMVLACPLNESAGEIEALFRQIERFRDGKDGDSRYDGVAGPTLTTVKDVRAAMTGLPAEAYDGQLEDGLPGVKSLSELLWMNPNHVSDPSQNMASLLGHITDNEWGDMQRYGYDGENNAHEASTPTIDNYPYDLDYSGTMTSASYYEDRDGDGDDTGETYNYIRNSGAGAPEAATFMEVGIDDNEERLHRYQYLTGTYSTRSDYFVLYGMVRAYETNKFQYGAVGSSRFMAIFDRHEGLDGSVKILGSALTVR